MVFAPGALATVPLSVRLGAAAAGMAAFFMVRRSVFAGVLVGMLGILIGVLGRAGAVAPSRLAQRRRELERVIGQHRRLFLEARGRLERDAVPGAG